MKSFPIVGHAGERIQSFNDWATHAMPPSRKKLHWKEGRSAFELGRIWTANGEPTAPAGLTRLLDSHEGTKHIIIYSGITEHETTLPFSNRGARCHDLALQAEQNDCSVTICIEAKADEPFGGTVAEELRKAQQRPVTRFPERLDWLTCSLLGLPAFKDEMRLELSDAIVNLPYQLFPAIAGTLLEAELHESAKAIFLVHEFRTTATLDAKLDANASALNRFLRLFCSTNKGASGDLPLKTDHMIGPILIIERPIAAQVKLPSHIPLFIGKIRTDRLA